MVIMNTREAERDYRTLVDFLFNEPSSNFDGDNEIDFFPYEEKRSHSEYKPQN